MVLTYSKEHYVDIYIFNFVDIIWRHKIFVKKIFLQKIFLPCCEIHPGEAWSPRQITKRENTASIPPCL